MYRLILLALVVSGLLTGCVSTSNLFQDGKTVGQGAWSAAVSASYQFTPQYSLDTVRQQVDLEGHKLPAPWLQLQAQYGLLERLDVGGSFGFGLWSIGGQVFTKVGLLPCESAWGVSLFGLAGIAGLNEEEISDEPNRVRYINLLAAVPVSYDLDERNTLVFQPMLSRDHYRFIIMDDDRSYEGTLHGTHYRLGLGYIRTRPSESRIHYNLALTYAPDSRRLLPTFGIALIPPP